MQTLDLVTPKALTHDGPTAVLRLEIRLQALPHDDGSLAATLNLAGVRGISSDIARNPLAVYLTASTGATVEVTSSAINIQHDDFRYTIPAPQWVREFHYECVNGRHPLLEGAPSIGAVYPVDPFKVARA